MAILMILLLITDKYNNVTFIREKSTFFKRYLYFK